MTVKKLERPGKPALAYVYTPPEGEGEKHPLVVFLGGYRSDMTGTKATYLEAQAKARGQAFLRFDYSGHGQSEGKFADGTIGGWKQDALDIIDEFAQNPVVLVGSSMGGWMALLASQARPALVKGLIGIAAAPDFTEDIYESLTTEQKKALEKTGAVEIPTDYSPEPYHVTKAFYEESKSHLLLDKPRAVDFPVRLIQGMKDTDVPWETAVKIQKTFGGDVDIVFIEDGDHRLSKPEDLEIIDREIKSISAYI